MAATNRPDILDPALLRPGRFDRQVTVDPGQQSFPCARRPVQQHALGNLGSDFIELFRHFQELYNLLAMTMIRMTAPVSQEQVPEANIKNYTQLLDSAEAGDLVSVEITTYENTQIIFPRQSTSGNRLRSSAGIFLSIINFFSDL